MAKQFWPLTQEFLNQIDTKYFDIHYCEDSPMQIMDLYYPNEKSDEPYPVIVHSHGGGFANGDQRENNAEPMLRGLERGYVVASVQYRRSREAFFPAQLYDVKAAIRYLRAHAEELQLDTDRFAIWGPSSGGWLASMTGVTAGNPAFEDLDQGNAGYSSEVQAVIDWCGPCGGFLEMDKALKKSGCGVPDHNEADSPESRFLGRPITEVPELVKLACPCTYVTEKTPPVCIIHGSADQTVPVEQSITFYNTLVEKAGEDKVEIHIVEGKLHHGDPWFHEPWVADICLDFLDKVLKKG